LLIGVKGNLLFDGDFGAANTFAGKAANFACLEGDNAVFGGVNSKVAAGFGAFAGALGHAHLADDNLAEFNLLAAKKLNAKALSWTIVNIFGCTASFYV
jgi:hypothetical protein